MSEMSDYKVSDEDPDIRGWNVVGADGVVIGEVDDLLVDTVQMKVRSIEVDVRGADHSIVPADRVHVDRQRREVRLAGTSDEQRFARPDAGPAGTSAPRASSEREREGRLTRSEEEVRVGKKQVEGGEYVIGKHVETQHVEQPVTLKREEVVIERRPVTADTPADPRTMGSGEVRVPLTHEEAVVEKRPVVKEEIVVGKRVVEDQETVETDVRREEFDIDKRSDKPRPRGRREE